jgi:hypothetical protein
MFFFEMDISTIRHLQSLHICTTGENCEENIPSTPSLPEPYHKTLDLLTVVSIQITFFWDVTPYSLVGKYQHFGIICSLQCEYGGGSSTNMLVHITLTIFTQI